MAPGSSYGAEGDGGTAPLAVTGLSVTQCLVCLFPVSYCFSLKDVFNNLPSRAAALAAGAPHGQLRLRYAAWVEWVASERKTPTEEYVANAGGYWGSPARWAGICATSSLRIRLFSSRPDLVVFLALCHGISSLFLSQWSEDTLLPAARPVTSYVGHPLEWIANSRFLGLCCLSSEMPRTSNSSTEIANGTR